jgi:hypothetical protein
MENPFAFKNAGRLLTVLALAATASAQAFVAETVVDALPTDVAVTPNGLQAVVRCAEDPSLGLPTYSDSLTVWDLANGNMLTITPCTGTSFGLGTSSYEASDRIECTNDRAISIGSTHSNPSIPSNDITLIDVIELGANPTCLANHAITGLPGQGSAGIPTDVAITPDGSYAIVNARNYVYVVELASGTIALTIPTAGTPLGGADTVACTNERAIVTTERFSVTYGRTWVFLIDLSDLSQPVVSMELADSINNPNNHYSPNDLAITPNGLLAVVSSNNIVGLYDLVARVELGRDMRFKRRFYRTQVDTVEVTNDRAVVTGDRMWVLPGGGIVFRWSIDVYSISPDLAIGLVHLREYENLQGTVNNSAHDLAISPEGTRAVVRSEKENILIDPLSSPPAGALELTSPNGSNPLAATGGAYPNVFTSDSVVIAAASGGQQFAMTLGSAVINPSPNNNLVGFVDFVELGSTSLQQVQHGMGVTHVVPGDLQLTRNGNRVVVRFAETSPDPGVIGGLDLTIFAIATQTEIATFGGSGNLYAMDSIGVGRDRVVSVSENLVSAGALHYGTGWVHVVDL